MTNTILKTLIIFMQNFFLKKINFCYLDSNKLQYLVKNSMKINFFSKNNGFVAQNIEFYPLKLFLPHEHL